MSETSDPTFRDFAGAIMGNDDAKAAGVLEVLLGLDGEGAAAATAHFRSEMAADPQFMMKAMGLRAAVTTGSDEDITALLGDCFGLQGENAGGAVATLRQKYPTPS
jgi:hypothetical protein